MLSQLLLFCAFMGAIEVKGLSTTESTLTIGVADSTCEIDSEPSDSCSILLSGEISIMYAITQTDALYDIVKYAWEQIADASTTLSLGNMEWYVEYLLLDITSNRRRLLQTSLPTAAAVETATPTDAMDMSTSDFEDWAFSTEIEDWNISIWSTEVEDWNISIWSTEVEDWNISIWSTEGEDWTSTTQEGEETSSTTTTQSGVSATSKSDTWSLTFRVAFFDGSCSTMDAWYNFFVSVGNSFESELEQYLETRSQTYSTNGFGDTTLVSVTLAERDQTGQVTQSTTFGTSDAHSLFYKHSFFFYSLFFVFFMFFLI